MQPPEGKHVQESRGSGSGEKCEAGPDFGNRAGNDQKEESKRKEARDESSQQSHCRFRSLIAVGKNGKHGCEDGEWC